MHIVQAGHECIKKEEESVLVHFSYQLNEDAQEVLGFLSDSINR